MTGTTARLTYVWLILCAVTIIAWALGSAHAALVASVPITVAVLVLALVKARLVIQEFMEVRTAPRWLRVFTDVWLVVLWGALLGIYLY